MSRHEGASVLKDAPAGAHGVDVYKIRSAVGFFWGLLLLSATSTAFAGGGYFVLGYGPYAHQTAGTATAIGFDGFAGSSNPAKFAFVNDRLDLDVLAFMPYRRIERTGSDTPYDFSSKSRNSFFLLPEIGYSSRINGRWTWGITIYGNGGLNTEYRDDTGIPGTNANPEKCGNRPGNFFLGCGKLGFDLAQLITAPSLSWEYRPGQSFGIAPLLAVQRIKIYGLQAFEALSEHPEAVSNRGYDYSVGGGVRLGWMGRLAPWLDVGVAYATRTHMQKFDRYRGLLADGGNFDIPENFSVGVALRPATGLEVGFDFQRIFFGDIPSLANGVQDSLEDPQGQPLGSKGGSGFNWRNGSIYRSAVAYAVSPRLTLRAGYAYGRRPPADASADSVSFNLFAPNPIRQATAGASYRLASGDEINFAYGRYIEKRFEGPSATSGLGVGGNESITPHVDTVMLGWTRFLGTRKPGR